MQQLATDTLAWWQALTGILQRPAILEIVTPPTPRWRTAIDVLAGLATAAVAWFAFLQMRRARAAEQARKRDADQRTATTDARIGTIAFALCRQIDSWLLHHAIVNLNSAGPWTDYLVGPTNVAEARLTEIMALAPDASPDVAEAVQLGFLWFYKSFDLINAIRELAQKGDHRAAADRLPDAKKRLERCRKRLTAAIPKDLRMREADVADELASGK